MLRVQYVTHDDGHVTDVYIGMHLNCTHESRPTAAAMEVLPLTLFGTLALYLVSFLALLKPRRDATP